MGSQHKTVQTGLTPKRIEFDTVKFRVVKGLPDTKKLNRIPVAKPVLNNVSGIVAILELGNVRQADKVIPAGIPLYTDLGSPDNQFVHALTPPC